MTRVGVLAALGLILATAGCGDRSSRGPAAAAPRPETRAAESPPASAVTTVTPEYRTRHSALETSGKVTFNEEALVRINATVTGRVIEVLAKPGDAVETGHRLLVVDSSDLGLAKTDYAKAVSDVERSEAALKLARELFEVRAIAAKEIRDAESEYRRTMAERERASSRLRTLGVKTEQLADIAARKDAATTLVITAPRGGVVVERNVTPGQVVAYGQSDTPASLFVIADLSTMWVLADVYEPDVPTVKPGQPMAVRLPCCPNDRYEGTVAYISDSVDRETRTVKVRGAVPNRGRALKAEMFVKVSIATGSTRALTVPQAAVHRENGATFVLVATGQDAYERRPVTLGADLDDSVEVRRGVTPSDRVVSQGSILLKKSAK
ncbi:MAG TPA: efflux RND transporter periplasmic adaptor subunit [Candidatus Acidoferrum sp.]|nr:efflux RND transporter periplasmic adaptor subunit [Candidatus Acidoferrum sp.]